jgi:3',5'-cyclic AMP phosphodiesterase CpdA
MRIAHVTDIHVQVRPGLSQLFNKRLLGTVNLYLMGRHNKFSPVVQQALVEAVVAQEPDVVACSGDLTAQATDEEFEAAHKLLAPMFSRQPTVLVAGNHDVYTRAADRDRRIEERFGTWTGTGDWPRKRLIGDDLAFVCVESCRAHLLSSGKVGRGQLERLDAMLTDTDLQGRSVFVMLHYPLRDRMGEPYGPSGRALSDARAVETVLCRHTQRITAVLHGHEHHGFRSAVPSATGAIPIFNPGSSGYAWLPDKGRRAHFCVYTVQQGQTTVERFAYDGNEKAFVSEPGGAWATGG